MRLSYRNTGTLAVFFLWLVFLLFSFSLSLSLSLSVYLCAREFVMSR